MLLLIGNHTERSHQSRPRQRRASGRSEAESLYGWCSGEYAQASLLSNAQPLR